MTVPTHSFRPADLENGSDDLTFLRQLYASTRQDELAQTGWPDLQIDTFLSQQFHAQHTHYIQHFPDATFDLILSADGSPIGRLYLDQRADEFRIIDIALLPTARGQGIGSLIMEAILQRAAGVNKMVRIHVEKNNPAMRLYLRLGFQPIEDQGIYQLMEWHSQSAISEPA